MASTWERWEKLKSDYPHNFEKRASWRKRHVKFTCEKCGAKRHEERPGKGGSSYKVQLAAAHVNHDPKNPRAKLIILCQVCHLEYDRDDHAEKSRKTYYRKQREAMLQAGQLELFGNAKRSNKRASK